MYKNVLLTILETRLYLESLKTLVFIIFLQKDDEFYFLFQEKNFNGFCDLKQFKF